MPDNRAVQIIAGENIRRPNRAAAFVFSAAALAAVLLLFYPFMNSIKMFAVCLCAGMLILIPGMLPRRQFTALIPSVLTVVSAIALFKQFSSGMGILINSVTDVLNARFSLQLTKLALSGGTTDLLIFFCILSASVSLLVSTLYYRRKLHYTAAILLCMTAAFVLLKIRIGLPAIIYIFSAAAMLFICGTNLSVQRPRSIIEISAGVIVIISVFCLILSPFTGSRSASTVKSAVSSGIHTVRFGNDTLPKGDMRRADAMQRGSDHVISVRMSSPHEEYLRSFIGAEYTDGSWSGAHPSDVMNGEWNGLFRWLSGEGFNEKTQNSAYRSLIGENPEAITLEIVNNSDREYIFTPYSMSELDDKLGKSKEDLGIKASGVFGRRSYTLTHSSYDNLEWDLIRLSAMAMPQSSTNDSYYDAANVYSAFVSDIYTKTDASVKEVMDKKFFSGDYISYERGGLYSVITRIRAVLELTASQTASPAKYSSDREFTDWFLNEAEEGNSAYFATAGALALRAAGYPARYAEGYYIPADAGENVTLTPRSAHAWCEVYIDGAGWMPVEFTPGYYSGTLLTEQTIEISKDAAGGNGSNKSPYSVSEEYDSNDTEENTAADTDILFYVLFIIISAALIIALTVLTLIIRAIIINNMRKRRFSGSGGERYMYAYIVKIMNLAGIKCDGSHPENYTDRIPKTFNGVRPQEYTRMITLMQKSVFGGAELQLYELRAINLYARKTAALLYRSSNPLKRLRLRFINAV